ncbi:conserved hypothetical protein [Trichinella spiralis]|uniref:hypothetical protein n=1 Tax=Trichinella spiralis TaxID=6334 RepID=UPI0001EFEFB3|nr:conserved hypothetical protein [Trichinella spiralis]
MAIPVDHYAITRNSVDLICKQMYYTLTHHMEWDGVRGDIPGRRKLIQIPKAMYAMLFIVGVTLYRQAYAVKENRQCTICKV